MKSEEPSPLPTRRWSSFARLSGASNTVSKYCVKAAEIMWGGVPWRLEMYRGGNTLKPLLFKARDNAWRSTSLEHGSIPATILQWRDRFCEAYHAGSEVDGEVPVKGCHKHDWDSEEIPGSMCCRKCGLLISEAEARDRQDYLELHAAAHRKRKTARLRSLPRKDLLELFALLAKCGGLKPAKLERQNMPVRVGAQGDVYRELCQRYRGPLEEFIKEETTV